MKQSSRVFLVITFTYSLISSHMSPPSPGSAMLVFFMSPKNFLTAALRFSAQRLQEVICVLIPSNHSHPLVPQRLTEELRQRPHMVLLNSPKVCLAALVV